MKKADSKRRPKEDPDMLPEYDFRGGVRGMHYKAYRQGHTVKIHKTDGSVSVHYFKPCRDLVMHPPAGFVW